LVPRTTIRSIGFLLPSLIDCDQEIFHFSFGEFNLEVQLMQNRER